MDAWDHSDWQSSRLVSEISWSFAGFLDYYVYRFSSLIKKSVGVLFCT